ncbi:MAG: phosphohistidine phosphatase SixA [uncultured bacterium]|nr:MAG: phosphohistidine phosphatase SixA [uncultured bacterium]
MKLYVMRHGIAASADMNSKRPLTEAGRQGVEKIARYLINSDTTITQIIQSGILRAEETSKIIATELRIPKTISSPELLGDQGSIDAILELLPNWKEDTLLIGHLPLLFQLINRLVIGNMYREPIVDFSPGTIVCLDSFSPKRWMIEWMLSPDTL